MKANIIEVITETTSIKSFRLRPEKPLDYSAGQWAYIQIPILKHHFTLSSSPTESFLQFTTMYRPESEYKRALWQKQVGDELEVTGSFGSFVLDPADAGPRLFIAGGIGITPFRSMLKYAVDKQLRIPITLLYSVRTRSDGAFVNWLTAQLADWLTVHVVETEIEGRLDQEKVKKLVPNWSAHQWWLCGPPAMVEAFTNITQRLALPPEKVKSEEFTGYE